MISITDVIVDVANMIQFKSYNVASPADATAKMRAVRRPDCKTVAMGNPQKGDLLSNRYQIEDLLGEGAMGRVYRAVDRESPALMVLEALEDELVLGALT